MWRTAFCAAARCIFMAVEDVDLSTTFLGKRLRYPLLVTGMTGGTERAGAVNRDLALVAERHGLAFGVGSQRAMAEDASRAPSFQVRQVAPTVALLGSVTRIHLLWLLFGGALAGLLGIG